MSSGKTAGVNVLYRFHTGDSELAEVKGQDLGAKALMTEKLLPTRRLFDETQRQCCPSEAHSCVKPQGGSGEIRQQCESLLYVISFKLLHKNKQTCSVFPDYTKRHNTTFIKALFKCEKLNIHNLIVI